MNICGFAYIKKDATTCRGGENPKDFIGNICAVLDFGWDGCVLVLNPQSTALAMFDKEDVYQKFECGYVDGVITPPNLDMLVQAMYVMKARTRIGGYNHILRDMVIQASLIKGVFYDKFLWERQ
jgi:hypothetical protein